jgi:hypothetical protein
MSDIRIVGAEGMSPAEIKEAVERKGAKLVAYQFCISIVVLSFRFFSPIHYIPPGERASSRGGRYSLLAFLFGWWGFPFGIFFTIQSLIINARGGHDVTQQVMREWETLGISEALEKIESGGRFITTNPYALASLILGILSLLSLCSVYTLLCVTTPLGLLAALLGIIGLRQIKRRGETGAKQAKIGIALGLIAALAGFAIGGLVALGPTIDNAFDNVLEELITPTPIP